MIADNELHHWSGWPGAFCIKCGCADPTEEAMADGKIDYDLVFNVAEGVHDVVGLKYAPGVEEEIKKKSICPVKGVLVWNTPEKGWDLQQPDGSIIPFTRTGKLMQ